MHLDTRKEIAVVLYHHTTGELTILITTITYVRRICELTSMVNKIE